MPCVLFVDDDQRLLDGIARSMRREPYTVVTCCGVEAARARLEQGGIDVVISDEAMPGASGADFLTEVRQSYPATMRLMLTGNASVGAAARALNGGEIFRFLVKPCANAELTEVVRQALAEKALMDRCRAAMRLLARQRGVVQALERARPGLVAQALATAPQPPALAVTLEEQELLERVEVAIRSGERSLDGASSA